MSRIRDAFGGRWATSMRTWAILAPLSILPVLMQEDLLSQVTFRLVLVSAVVQHAVSAIPLLVAGRCRRSGSTIPVWGFLAAWSSVAGLRGVAGGIVETELLGSPPDFALRIAFWLGIAWVWVPLFVYVQSKFDSSRELDQDILRRVTRRDAALVEGARIDRTLRTELVSTVHSTVIPVIDDIRRGLSLASSSFDSVSLRTISDRLAVVTGEATRIVAGEPAEPQPAALPEPVRPRFLNQFAVAEASPLVISTFTAGLLTAVVLPSSTISIGPPTPLVALGAVLASSVVLAMLIDAGSRLSRRSPWPSGVWAAGSSLVAGAVGSMVLLWPSPTSVGDKALVLAAAFPLAVLASSALVTAAVTVARANERAQQRLSEIADEIRTIEHSRAQNEARVRSQLSTVMHGPVYGRLSACVMALNFSASENLSTSSHRGRVITAGIIDHLDRASDDLDRLRKDSPA